MTRRVVIIPLIITYRKGVSKTGRFTLTSTCVVSIPRVCLLFSVSRFSRGVYDRADPIPKLELELQLDFKLTQI